MASPQSPHLANIPQAIRFAADPAVEPGLKQQALDYLRQVKEACDETWQVCFFPSTQKLRHLSSHSLVGGEGFGSSLPQRGQHAPRTHRHTREA